MPEYGCMISWAGVRTGREAKAMEVWADALNFYSKTRADGRIEDFEVIGFGSSSDVALGAILLRGEREGLETLMESEEFERQLQRAALVVDGLRVSRFVSGDRMLQTVQSYAEELQNLGI